MGLIRIFYVPEKVFSELPEKRAWVLPLIAAVLVALVTGLVVVNRIGLEMIVRNAMESNPRTVEQMGQAKIDEIAQQAASSTLVKVLSYAGPPVGTLALLLLIAGVLAGVLALAGSSASYDKILAVCSYSHFACALVAGIMATLILMLMSDYSGLDPGGLVRLNPTILMDKTTTARPLYSLASSFDLLTFWRIFLIALGLSKTAPRLRLQKALGLVAAPWAVYVLLKMGWAAIF